MNKKKILFQPWGGLGDNLQFSTLPEKYNKLGFDFYIHKNNSFRNKEIFDLVWGLNPFVKGFSDEQYNCGSNLVNLNNNCEEYINKIESSHGVELSEEPFPKIYYNPNFLDFFKDKIVVNLFSVSSDYSNEKIKTIEIDLKKENEEIIFLNFENSIIDNEKIIIGERKLEHKESFINIDEKKYFFVKNIFEHCDIIFSCKKYICLYSGASVLASSIKRNKLEPQVLVYITDEKIKGFNDFKLYNFKNLDYKKI